MADSKLNASTMAVFPVRGDTELEAKTIVDFLQNIVKYTPHDVMVKLANKTKKNPSVIRDIFGNNLMKMYLKKI